MPGFDVITFLTDFGHRDTFVGVCHGVLASRAPHARVIDLTHEVPPHDIATGALLLARAVAHLPVAVHLAVVDPGVGTDRHGIAAVTGRGDVLVGPDNGLLEPAARALGGVTAVFTLPRPAGGAVTFDGRDVFSPAAARIATGTAPAALGPAHPELIVLSTPSVEVGTGWVRTPVLTIDRFGNCQLAATPTDLDDAGVGGAIEATIGERSYHVRRVRAFGQLEPGDLGILADSDGQLALVLDQEAAAAALGVVPGDPVLLQDVHRGTGSDGGASITSA